MGLLGAGADRRRESAANRRKEERVEVEIAGRVECAGAWYDVVVSDLSPSGALIEIRGSFARGMQIALHLEAFGVLEAQVAHAASGFCGLQFVNPAAHRDRLTDWLANNAGPVVP